MNMGDSLWERKEEKTGKFNATVPGYLKDGLEQVSHTAHSKLTALILLEHLQMHALIRKGELTLRCT